MIPIEYYLLITSILILISIVITRFSNSLGIPALILFIGIGMLAGSEGIGNIYFDDPALAQAIGIIALIFILFSGGLDTQWISVRPVLWQALNLATFGVIITAGIIGFFAHLILGIPLLSSFLIGAIISSTDAAAVFAVLGSKNTALKKDLKPLLELESGSNDPMAVFLTIGLIQLYVNPEISFWELFRLFIFQMGLGTILGIIMGRLMLLFISYLKMPYSGVYAVFAMAFACLIYAVTALLGGSGILAVYLAGIIVGNHEFVQKKILNRFFDSIAWLSQISVFLVLGLLVFPSQLIKIAGAGILLSVILMFIARPVSVFISLAFTKLNWREKSFISWVGLRGAVPIILATFPLLYKVPNAGMFFSLVFFIVLTSALLQGWTLNTAAKLFKVDAPFIKRPESPIEFAPVEGVNADLLDFYIPENSENIGKTIAELFLPEDSLVVLINRKENYLVPSGNDTIEYGDILLVLVSNASLSKVKEIFLR